MQCGSGEGVYHNFKGKVRPTCIDKTQLIGTVNTVKRGLTVSALTTYSRTSEETCF